MRMIARRRLAMMMCGAMLGTMILGGNAAVSADAGIPTRLIITDQLPKGDALRQDAVVQVDPVAEPAPDQPTDDAS
ncbi:MAG: hypothetical protein M3176_10880 [Chloroflexota bacterium]|nr:hypothetical protein [Chloroflexota bacterium]MDQ6907322.1 hypothetical protein [Chloroflexota bacterium]